jgi:hypothetical protein
VLGTAGVFAEAQSKKVVFLLVQNFGQGFTGIIEKLATEYSHQTNMTLPELVISCVVMFNKNRISIQGGIHV